MEWCEDVVVFPITGREPGTMFKTTMTNAVVVYDFAEWKSPGGAASAAAAGDEPGNPRICSLIAHAAVTLQSGGSVCFSSLHVLRTDADLAWLDPKYVSGEQWELCPHGSGAVFPPRQRAAERDDAFKTYLANAISTHLVVEYSETEAQARHTVESAHFLKKGNEWDAQLRRGELLIL